MIPRGPERLSDRLPNVTPEPPADVIRMQSASIDQLVGAKARADVLLRNVHKGSANPFFKSDYADLDAITRIVRPIYGEHGMAFVQAPWLLDGRHVLITTLAHESGQWIRSVMPIDAMPDKNGVITPQATGSAITYAKRYALSAMANLAQTDEDDDAEAAMGRPPVGQDPPPGAKPFNIAEVIDDEPTVVVKNVENIEDTLTFDDAAAADEKSSLIASLKGCLSANDLAAWERDNDGELAWVEQNDANAFEQIRKEHTRMKGQWNG